MSACAVTMLPRAVPGTQGATCGRPAAVTVEFGCVHEHTGRAVLCAFHARDIASGHAACVKCWDDHGHECKLLGRVVVAP